MSSTGRAGSSRPARPVLCVVVVPMLGRGHLMDRLRESLAASTDDARILWVVTGGDFDVLDRLDGDDYVLTPPRPRGDYAHKINAGVAASDEPLIFTGAIDLASIPAGSRSPNATSMTRSGWSAPTTCAIRAPPRAIPRTHWWPATTCPAG